jgi:hypothetical protein
VLDGDWKWRTVSMDLESSRDGEYKTVDANEMVSEGENGTFGLFLGKNSAASDMRIAT